MLSAISYPKFVRGAIRERGSIHIRENVRVTPCNRKKVRTQLLLYITYVRNSLETTHRVTRIPNEMPQKLTTRPRNPAKIPQNRT